MLAYGANEIVWQRFTIIYPTAYLAGKTALLISCGLWLYVGVVVRIGHALGVGNNAGFGDVADEHAVGAQINVFCNLKGHICVDVLGEIKESV